MYPGLRSGRCRSCGGNWRNDICGGAASVLVSGVCVRRKIFRDFLVAPSGATFFVFLGLDEREVTMERKSVERELKQRIQTGKIRR